MRYATRKIFSISIIVFLVFGFVNPAQADTGRCCVRPNGCNELGVSVAAVTACRNSGGEPYTVSCSTRSECSRTSATTPISGQPTQRPVTGSTGPKGPAADPLCWTKPLCESDKGDFIKDARGKCVGIWGLCYPKPEANVYNLQISIGGVRQVTNISNYVRIGYQAGLGIAFTASIVLVMVAGFRWMTAGGNAGAIGQAKTMMGNVAIGIILLLGAYLIFQTINPDITKLTLPRVAKIRGIKFASTSWCLDQYLPNTDKLDFAPAGIAPNLNPPTSQSGSNFGEIKKVNMASTKCGTAYYPITDSETACLARNCEKIDEVCLLQPDRSYKCVKSTLAGEISEPDDISIERLDLWEICIDGEVSPLTEHPIELIADVSAYSTDPETLTNGKQTYTFGNLTGPLTVSLPNCDSHGGQKGFMLSATVRTLAVNLTTLALKRTGNTCSVFDSSDDIYDFDNNVPNPLVAANAGFFFQRQELISGGLKCDVSLRNDDL